MEISQDLLVTYYDNGVTDGEYSGRIKRFGEMAEAIRIWSEMPYSEATAIFGAIQLTDILRLNRPEVFVDKCMKWKEIHDTKSKYSIGDYVEDSAGNLCVITNIDSSIHVVYPNGKTHKWKKGAKFTKLGFKAPIMIDAITIMQQHQEKKE